MSHLLLSGRVTARKKGGGGLFISAAKKLKNLYRPFQPVEDSISRKTIADISE